MARDKRRRPEGAGAPPSPALVKLAAEVAAYYQTRGKRSRFAILEELRKPWFIPKRRGETQAEHGWRHLEAGTERYLYVVKLLCEAFEINLDEQKDGQDYLSKVLRLLYEVINEFVPAMTSAPISGGRGRPPSAEVRMLVAKMEDELARQKKRNVSAAARAVAKKHKLEGKDRTLINAYYRKNPAHKFRA
jgi:hypothetical protein